ncbi:MULTISPECIES: exopolysaccharide biosynthesis protein [Fischerella]|uniref:exopolysaccharide biosynthesis protein n=1 Tax=Fischerella TaxID=1190 RepID=UPI0002EA7118|nr:MULTISPECIES: exopolysaccharide biosynthesis protein [Fischerella]MBD2431525.1 exopolysaccharide biosynthesis protein [Fischerella sp. FACHB-380]
MLPAIVILIIALGLIEQDGVVIMLGVLGACVIIATIAFAISAIGRFVLMQPSSR